MVRNNTSSDSSSGGGPPSGGLGADLVGLTLSPGESSSPAAARSLAFRGVMSPSRGLGVRNAFSTSISVGVSMIRILDSDGLCLGAIGEAGTKFCCKTKDACGTVKHRSNKVADVKPGLYLKPGGSKGMSVDGAVALVNPYFDCSCLGELLRKAGMCLLCILHKIWKMLQYLR